MHAVPGLPLPCCSMPRGRTSTTRGAAVRQPSQRRAAIRKRAAETAPPMPAPPVRRRRPVSAAAGRPDESVIPDGGPSTVSTSTAEMVAIVTREVLKQLHDDRAAVPVPVPAAPVDVPAAPIAVPDLMMPPVAGNPPDAADQVDNTVAGAIDALLRGEQGEPTLPQTLPLHTTELGADLSDKVKAKIWENEYVDFYELVNTSKRHQMPDYAHPLLSLIPQGKVRQISSIEQWTSAFLVFGAVYTQRFPDKAPGLFKYCEVVRDIANTGPPFAWRQYDEQFRAFRHSNPPSFPWDQPRWDLFFKCMYAKQIQGGPSRAPPTVSRNPSRRPQPFPAGYCWVYQRGGGGGQMCLQNMQVQTCLCQMSSTSPFHFLSQAQHSPHK